MTTCTSIPSDAEALSGAAVPAAAPLARVLLIEDNVEEMSMVKFTLQEFGRGQYELEWTNNLGDAVLRLREGGLDVVLLDLGLPECQGPVSCAAVRYWAPYVPIVVLTADCRKETEEVAMAYGADDYLVKDEVSGPGLVHAIRAALYRKKARSSRLDSLSATTGKAQNPFS
jgi:phosphoserine phosphatase RsbU/P